MRVVITVEALTDLHSILIHIAHDSPTQAILMTGRLERASLALGDAALRYPLLPHRESHGVRRRVVRPYNIFYRVTGDLVEVVHILHGAREYERILFPDD